MVEGPGGSGWVSDDRPKPLGFDISKNNVPSHAKNIAYFKINQQNFHPQSDFLSILAQAVCFGYDFLVWCFRNLHSI